MTATQQELDSFAQYAREQIGRGGEDLSIDEIFDRWRCQHPPDEDALAIKASLRDMERGARGRPLKVFADEFRERNKIPKP